MLYPIFIRHWKLLSNLIISAQFILRKFPGEEQVCSQVKTDKVQGTEMMLWEGATRNILW
jgi:hypothetical protein